MHWGQVGLLLPDSHEPKQGPAGVVDLGFSTLHVCALLAGLKILSPPTICHLLGDEELAGLGHLSADSPAGMGVRIKTEHVWTPTILSGKEMWCPLMGLPQEFKGQAVSALTILQAQDLGGAAPEAEESMHSLGIHPAPPESYPGPGGW